MAQYNDDFDVARKLIKIAGFVFVSILALIFVLGSMFTINQTEVGIVTRLGAFQYIAEPGFHWKAPLIDSVIVFPKVQIHYEYTEAAEGDLAILTSDGLSADAEASLYLTIVDPMKVYETIGPGYENWIDGKSRGVFREATADFSSDALYNGTQKDQLQNLVITHLQKVVGDGFYVNDFQVRRVLLPKSTQDAIEKKMAAQQTIQTKQYELEAAQIEAQKVMAAANGTAQSKIIDAIGEAEAITLVRSSLTSDYLKYLSITEVANSNNTKLVFLPANSSVLVGFGGLN